MVDANGIEAVSGKDESKQQRFFLELNEPIAVKGFNPAGLLPGVLISAIPLGLGMFSWVFGILAVSLILARRMVHRPRLTSQLASRLKARPWTLPAGEDRAEQHSIGLPNGMNVTLSEWASLRNEAGSGDESAAALLF